MFDRVCEGASIKGRCTKVRRRFPYQTPMLSNKMGVRMDRTGRNRRVRQGGSQVRRILYGKGAVSGSATCCTAAGRLSRL